MGIGGLDTEFNAIFRRAFASRVFPPEVVYQLGTERERESGDGKTSTVRSIRNEALSRYSSLWSTRNRKNTDGSVNDRGESDH